MKFKIPHGRSLELSTIILDLNGTLAERGALVAGVSQRIQQLKAKKYTVVLFSGNTRGNAAAIAKLLGIRHTETKTGAEKAKAARKLKPKHCVAIGNGLIDAKLFRAVALSIAVVGAEGAHTKTLAVADIVTKSVCDALDLLIDEQSLIATIRP